MAPKHSAEVLPSALSARKAVRYLMAKTCIRSACPGMSCGVTQGLQEPTPIFLLGVMFQDLLIQYLQHKNQLCVSSLTGRVHKQLSGHIWHMENETWNTWPEKQTGASWRWLRIKQKLCWHRLGLTSFILLLSILPSFFFIMNSSFLLKANMCSKLYSEHQYSIRGEHSP